MNEVDEKTLGQKVYDVATGLGMEPKALFTTMYAVLIGKEQGPRLASFMKIIGKEKLEKMLNDY
jgi:lysyl-tRNA synthetase class 1